ncbi:MAG: LL-diaminopimelate aminotransferase [Provencibacterium sp.]|jgi:LL-diaminopimelate aminotransferase|nr:LL-diaminopimelate aminotransferase [Provencibacterium sp.]
MKLNEHYFELTESYLFSDIARRVKAFAAAHPDQKIIRMGIGDVTRPLPPAVTAALEGAAREMGQRETFRGYGPEQGYPFLREAVAAYYQSHSTVVSPEEIFIGDGAKSDLGNILDLFSPACTVLIPDPVYPVYVDTNVMAGRRIVYLNASGQNGFLPLPDPRVKADILYICSPNNPTGAAYDRQGLQAFVDYARENGALILYDAAYEAFITDPALPRSIYEIEGARQCAIEFCSLSKTAGFTGLRCGYTVVPQELVFEGHSLRAMWLRRQTTKFNGVSYPVQRAAAVALSEEGRRASEENISYYRENARLLMQALDKRGIFYTGGRHSPYLFMRCENGMGSWQYFDWLLENAGIVGTPGAGFGKNGENYFRLSAFGGREETKEAAERLLNL